VRRIKTGPPFFLSTNVTAHTMIDIETMMASTPVIRRLGIMVIAGSPPKIINSSDSPHDFITNPPGAMFPCNISGPVFTRAQYHFSIN
jgi:hypothetical protein